MTLTKWQPLFDLLRNFNFDPNQPLQAIGRTAQAKPQLPIAQTPASSAGSLTGIARLHIPSSRT